MKTCMLVTLDNSDVATPRSCLWPHPDGTPGHNLFTMIQEQDPDFTEQDFIKTFARASLYNYDTAPGPRNGQSREARRADRYAAGMLMTMADQMHIDDIVLCGHRVAAAFEPIIGRKLEPWESAIKERDLDLVRVWMIPHPSVRNGFWKIESNRRNAGRLLMKLRDRFYCNTQRPTQPEKTA